MTSSASLFGIAFTFPFEFSFTKDGTVGAARAEMPQLLSCCWCCSVFPPDCKLFYFCLSSFYELLNMY